VPESISGNTVFISRAKVELVKTNPIMYVHFVSYVTVNKPRIAWNRTHCLKNIGPMSLIYFFRDLTMPIEIPYAANARIDISENDNPKMTCAAVT